MSNVNLHHVQQSMQVSGAIRNVAVLADTPQRRKVVSDFLAAEAITLTPLVNPRALGHDLRAEDLDQQYDETIPDCISFVTKTLCFDRSSASGGSIDVETNTTRNICTHGDDSDAATKPSAAPLLCVHLVNFADHPNSFLSGEDFITTLRAADGAIIVVNYVDGVTASIVDLLRDALRERIRPFCLSTTSTTPFLLVHHLVVNRRW